MKREGQLYAISQDPNRTQHHRDLALSMLMTRRYDDQVRYVANARKIAPEISVNPPAHLCDRVTGQLFDSPVVHHCEEEQHVLNLSTVKEGEICPLSGKPVSEEPFKGMATQECVYAYVLGKAQTIESTASLNPITRSPWEKPSIDETFDKIQRTWIHLVLLPDSKLDDSKLAERATKICSRLLPYKRDPAMCKVYGFHYQALTNDFQLTAPMGAYSWGEDRFWEPVGSCHDLTIKQQLSAKTKAMKMFLHTYLEENPEFFRKKQEYFNTHIHPSLKDLYDSCPTTFTKIFGESFVQEFFK
ncbi:MAG: hypothetical protein V4492_04200 [Chlamydiota bacterium]